MKTGPRDHVVVSAVKAAHWGQEFGQLTSGLGAGKREEPTEAREQGHKPTLQRTTQPEGA